LRDVSPESVSQLNPPSSMQAARELPEDVPF
jgi:hypothetical protein